MARMIIRVHHTMIERFDGIRITDATIQAKQMKGKTKRILKKRNTDEKTNINRMFTIWSLKWSTV